MGKGRGVPGLSVPKADPRQALGEGCGGAYGRDQEPLWAGNQKASATGSLCIEYLAMLG